MKNSIQHIRAFLAVAHTGNFAKAAAALNLSPSALTVQIQQLEDWLGVALLERSPRHVTLTSAGQNNLLPMEKLLLDLDNIVSASRDLAALRRGVVTIAALPSLCAGALPPLLKQFREQFPGIEVRLRDVVARRIDTLVRDGEVDFGLGVRARTSHGLEFQSVLEDRLCLFIPADHRLASRRKVKLSELTTQPIILTGRDSSVRELVEQLFADANLALSPGLEANYMSTVLALVRQGLGVSLLPESADEGREGLVKIPVNHPGVTRQIGLIFRQGQTMAPAAEQFIKMSKVFFEAMSRA
ncbi:MULTISPECIES: LysR family transcriptional regulator [unclassified Pseudomonas]|uniref:LysR family transcriptional regulator n=1 Tax=unclassified Pseudomonas TaxID=196821 RepID=UPI001199229D|nr:MULTISPECIES: LysR family transcriptional regulator [unclassified Pseudomonas]TWC22909.1 LysR family transcriptional regulator [Pseudomonas sp. SJZ075]TWC24827.1 LysR family transcriptional regulator [Pseudomonas sp. SJZ074]TWC38211.1 LysR family transcriptional regulator [Pseudomonas sp. SJZ078]TWC40956.1 LysR family transcriptional regulator [Pseudomonas sp. SJZ085]TWC58801.1 LysR family transcriptional regulator [Pseudomonas sp. SJZ124]